MTDHLRQYLITALWSSLDNNDNPLDDNHDIQDIDQASIEKHNKELNDFIDQAIKMDLIDDDTDLTDIAHDFWLTRNRHGAGFWDGDYPRVIGEKLTDLSHKFGECWAYLGDDGKIYLD